jgi:hypothetical protein
MLLAVLVSNSGWRVGELGLAGVLGLMAHVQAMACWLGKLEVPVTMVLDSGVAYALKQ